MKFQQNSATSRAAAVKILATADTLRGDVYRFIVQFGDWGATDEEIQIGLRLNPSTQRPRRVELVEVGVIEDSQKKRRTASGRWAVVWSVSKPKRQQQKELF